MYFFFFFFSSRRRHTRWNCDWSSDVCSSDLRTVGRVRSACDIRRRMAATRWHERRTGGQIAQTELGRELLLPGRLDVLDLVHGLAQARELPVHLLARAVGVPQRLVLGEAVPRVVAKDV